MVLVVKNLPANAGDRRDAGSVPGSGRSPGGGHGTPLQYSCLENPTDRGAVAAYSPGGCTESDVTEQARRCRRTTSWGCREVGSSLLQTFVTGYHPSAQHTQQDTTRASLHGLSRVVLWSLAEGTEVLELLFCDWEAEEGPQGMVCLLP